ncbi:putative diphthine synthase [Helianthus annuus]|nr:putative diphthine synthase [Helianthus annuus]
MGCGPKILKSIFTLLHSSRLHAHQINPKFPSSPAAAQPFTVHFSRRRCSPSSPLTVKGFNLRSISNQTKPHESCSGERDVVHNRTGLGDEKDITLRGLEAVKKSQKIYIESYTSLLSFGISEDGISTLEKLYGKALIVADREMVEEKVDDMLLEAREFDVAFLVVGDPFGATTHSDLVVRAKKMDVEVKVIYNASVMNAVGVCGLQLYRYGETVSLPFFTETWRPDSFYEKIQKNRGLGLHTLCLLDIRVKEPSLESLCRGKKQYEPPSFMTIGVAIDQLLEVEQLRGESAYNEDTLCVGFARLGSENQMVVAGSMKQLRTVDFGPPLHCLTIVGKTHPVEEEMLDFYRS